MGIEKICPFCKILGTLKQTSHGFVIHSNPEDKSPSITLMVFWCSNCKLLIGREEKTTI